jgi:hypothetical protein
MKGRDATMSNLETASTPRRPRRRLAAWAAFGALGLATGAVWASGFLSTPAIGTGGVNGPSAALTKGAPAVSPDTLSGTASTVTVPAFNFTGRWGAVANTTIVKVDLSTQPVAGTYNVAILLSNTASLVDWASLQLKLERVPATAGVCDETLFDGAQDAQVMKFDATDAGAYWNGLAGGHVADIYCFGVDASAGNDVGGTFLRSAQDTPPTHFPTFLTTVDRAS